MSFPPGLDVREYGYGVKYFVVPAGGSVNLGTLGQWLISKIQAYNGANAATIGLVHGGDVIDIKANGCLCLEPAGTFRGDVVVAGEGLTLVIEFWYQANPERGGDPPTVIIT